MSSKVLIWATSTNELRLKYILSIKACAFVKICWKELKSLTWTSGALIGEGLLDVLKPYCWARGTSWAVGEYWNLEVNPEDHPELFWEPMLWFPTWGVELNISHPDMGEDCWLYNIHDPSVEAQLELQRLVPLLGGEPGQFEPGKTKGNCTWLEPWGRECRGIPVA